MRHVALGPSVTSPAVATMESIKDVCTKYSGHENLVPCRLCTAWVARQAIVDGLTPEETHHEVAALDEFYAGERKRRDDRILEIKEEMKSMKQAARKTRASTIQKKPARMVVGKRPAGLVRTKRKYNRAKTPGTAMRRSGRRTAVAQTKPSRA